MNYWIVNMRWTRVVRWTCALGLVAGCETSNDPPSSSTETGAESSSGAIEDTSEREPADADTDAADAGTTEADDSGGPAPWEGLEGDAERGAEIFAMTCGQANCHGRTGAGPDLGSRIPSASNEAIAATVLNGISAGCDRGFCPGMPAQDLDPQEFADVLVYLRLTYPSR